jgi:hypothetical protein
MIVLLFNTQYKTYVKDHNLSQCRILLVKEIAELRDGEHLRQYVHLGCIALGYK